MIRVDLLIFEFLRIRGLIFPASQNFNNSQILCQRKSSESLQSSLCKNTNIESINYTVHVNIRNKRAMFVISVSFLTFEFLRKRGLIFPALKKVNKSLIPCQQKNLRSCNVVSFENKLITKFHTNRGI